MAATFISLLQQIAVTNFDSFFLLVLFVFQLGKSVGHVELPWRPSKRTDKRLDGKRRKRAREKGSHKVTASMMRGSLRTRKPNSRTAADLRLASDGSKREAARSRLGCLLYISIGWKALQSVTDMISWSSWLDESSAIFIYKIFLLHSCFKTQSKSFNRNMNFNIFPFESIRFCLFHFFIHEYFFWLTGLVLFPPP